MSVEKLLGKLDDLESKIQESARSREAEKEASEVGNAAVQKELDAQRLQLADIAARAARFEAGNRSERDSNRYIAEVVAKSIVTRAQSEGTDASGGYAVPEDWLTEVRSTQNRYGAVRKIWGNKIIPLTTDVTKVPVRSHGDTAGNQPEMDLIAEAEQMSADDGKIGQVTLTAKKYGVLVYVSAELMADAFLDYVGGYLRDQIGHEASKKEDDLVFNDATDGLLNHADFQETDMTGGDFSDATIENLRALQDQVTDEAWEAGAYYSHRSVRTQIANVRVGGSTTTDGPFAWGNPNIGVPMTLDGYPYDHVGKMPANSASAVSTEFLLFGDLPSAMLVGQRTAGELATSREFRFDFDQVAVRYLFRFAFGHSADTGYAAARLKTAAS